MADTGQENPFEIPEDPLHGLAPGGRDGGDIFLDVARLERGKDGEFLDILEIIGNPVHELVPDKPKILVFHAFLLDK
jgi:hypothetical protein